jgi:putative FmdB family regulatory protein
MPTYDYECKECDHTFEEFHVPSKYIKKCPECSGKVKRLIGAGAGLIFKGSGFYATDHRSTKYTEEKEYASRQARKSERCGNKSTCSY